ncbi:MAG: radical SAM protein, partial [Deltaproteobacteria bacterium]|nr:radical SAM protein [Deltaproteobacteria bacterium]
MRLKSRAGRPSRKRRLIIPIFIPHEGCPHQCVFCNQTDITGQNSLPAFTEVSETIAQYLSTWRGEGPREVAFYGGSFTGLSDNLQRDFLETAYAFIQRGEINAVRVSTRPDYISHEKVKLLREYGVGTVELGVQSMDDGVLGLSGRGHTAGDTVRAVELLRTAGLTIGLQMMPGLPGDTRETILATAREIVSLRPDFVRVYPTLVIKNTPLEKLYRRGDYCPWLLESMVEVCREVMSLFDNARIPVVRMGLQPTVDLEESIVAGPYHPSFRQFLDDGSHLSR